MICFYFLYDNVNKPPRRVFKALKLFRFSVKGDEADHLLIMVRSIMLSPDWLADNNSD